MNKSRLLCATCCLFLAIIEVVISPAYAVDKFWISGSGDWSDTSKWVGGQLPQNGNSVYLGSASTSDQIINYDISSIDLGSFFVGGRFEQISGILNADSVEVGYANRAEYLLQNSSQHIINDLKIINGLYNIRTGGNLTVGGNLYNSGRIFIGPGTLSVSGEIFNTGQLDIFSVGNTFNTINNTGGSMHLYEDLTLGTSTTLNNSGGSLYLWGGTLTNAAGHTLENLDIFANYSNFVNAGHFVQSGTLGCATCTGDFTLAAGGTMNTAGATAINDEGTRYILYENVNMAEQATNLFAGYHVYFENNATLTIPNNIVTLISNLNNKGNIINEGVLNLDSDIHGELNYGNIVNNGILEYSDDSFGSINLSGEMSGIGVYSQQGGILNLSGEVSQQTVEFYDADILFGIGGNADGEFGNIIASDSILFSNTGIEVEFIDLGSGIFNPSAGDSFDILIAETISGINGITLPTLNDGLAWDVDYLFDDFGTDIVRLNVTSTVPIPTAVWLFGSGLIGLIGVARRKARA